MPIFLWSLVVTQSTSPESRKRRRGAAIAPALYAMLAALRTCRANAIARRPTRLRHRRNLYQVGQRQTLRQRKEPGRPGTYRMLAIDKECRAWYGKFWSAGCT
jgi:hypothetical protein